MSRLKTVAMATFVIALGACGNPMQGMDAGTDTGPRDSGNDSATTLLCRNVAIEDLNTIGMKNGAVTSFSGTNAAAADSTSTGIQIPDQFSDVCNFRTTRQRVFQYRVQTRSALKITTSNPGTEAGFDTTLAVSTRCMPTTQVVACNDDDPRFSGDSRRLSSIANTAILNPGTTVFIAVGGFVPFDASIPRSPQNETGMFELSVEELAPQAANATCDLRGFDSVCDPATTCTGADILSETGGTCKTNGSAAGTKCDANNGCMGTLNCDTQNGTCFSIVTDGMPCDRFSDGWSRCNVATSSCVSLQRDSVRGVCAAKGSVAGAECDSMSMCASGLQCQTGTGSSICLRPATTACSTWDTACPMGQACAATTLGGTPGTCVAAGSRAGLNCAMGSCGSGLTCDTQNNVCQNAVASGGACDGFSVCANNGTCFITDPANRVTGQCFDEGKLGGACRISGTACDMGTCSVMTPTAANQGRCEMVGTLNGACRVFGNIACPTGSECVPTGPNSLDGTCKADGTAAGATCRETGTACDMGTCSSANGGICQTAATTTCDPRWNTTKCPTGQTCRATSLTAGTCAAPGMETEPNNALAAPQAVATLPASVRGALTRFDLDCYRVSVPAGQKIFARANSASGFCPAGDTADLAIDLYDANGALIGGDTNSGSYGCPRIDGTSTAFPWAVNSGAAAANFTVCVRNNADNAPAIDNYVVDIATAP